MLPTRQRARVIVNPTAGGGATLGKWKHIESLLAGMGLPFDYVCTEATGHATELAQDAVSQGYDLVVAVGGDGTVNEVVNGLIDSSSRAALPLGVIGTGTGADFLRSVGIPRDYCEACSRLTSERRISVDVGIVEYMSGGQHARRFFVNCAGLGFDAAVVEATRTKMKLLPGTVSYLVGLVKVLVGHQNSDVVLALDGEGRNIRVCSVVVANGGYFGGGMNIAPNADPSDGLFSVVIIGDTSKFELLRTLPRVYSGTHVTHPKVSTDTVSWVSLESTQKLLLHADGELLGETPASFTILPSALEVIF